MSQHLVDSPPATDAQHATASDRTEDATERKDPVGAVLQTHELLVMILSQLSMKDLGRTLPVSKQWNESILDSLELRRTLFLEPRQGPREYLFIEKVRDTMEHDLDLSSVQPFVMLEPQVVRGGLHQVVSAIVEPHPYLLKALKDPGMERNLAKINFSDFGKFKTVPPSTFLFQPPLDNITIEHWGRRSQVQIPGGVTFGAVLAAIENIRAENELAIMHSPRFAGRLYSTQEKISLSIRTHRTIANDEEIVKIARPYPARQENSTVLDKQDT